MASILQLPAMLSEDAQAIGFAAHYRVPHLPIDVPDGGFTITVKTARGRRVTFFFGPAYGPGEPEVVHIQYHDRGSSFDAGDGTPTPTFDVYGVGIGDQSQTDRLPDSEKPTIVVIPLESAAG